MKLKKLLFTTAFIVFLLWNPVKSQVAINMDGAEPDSSSMLDIKCDNKGILIPRLSNFDRDQVQSPAVGLLIYNVTTNLFNYYDGTSWTQLKSSFLTVNSGSLVSPGGMQIGRTNNQILTGSAILDLNDSRRGILIPRTTSEQIATPVNGLLIYNIQSNQFQYYTQGIWLTLCSLSLGIPGAEGTQESVGTAINTNMADPDPSSILDITSSDKGLLIPRLTTSQRNALLPSIGLTIFNTSTQSLEYYSETGWYKLNTLYQVSVEISSSTPIINPGMSVTFSAHSSTPGTNPIYQWRVNNNNAGDNSNIFVYSPSENDVITCNLISNAECSLNHEAISNPIIISITNNSIYPIISSPDTLYVPENTVVAGTVQVSSPIGGVVIDTIIGVLDAAKFSLNTLSGTLSFVSPPNFEHPQSSDSTNTYRMILQATSQYGFATSKPITIIVTNVNETPSLNIDSLYLAPENQLLAGTIIASDPDTYDAVTFSLLNSSDSSKFSINPGSGVLSFTTPPDFENPGDSNGDNNYQVVVKAVDIGGLFANKPITVRVTDVYQAETEAYIMDVDAMGGTVINKALCDSEVTKAKNEGYLSKIGFWIDNNFGVRTGTGLKEPVVGFCFDDSKAIDYSTYQAFIQTGPGRGTSFINTKFIGTPGYLTWPQIYEMRANGWDFQCHTWSHARSNLLPGGDVDVILGLTGCTNDQIYQELQTCNNDFTAHGLPLPKHIAYPNYQTDWTRVTPIVAKYRKSMRVGGLLPVTNGFYDKISWVSYWGPSCSFNNSDLLANEAKIDDAVRRNEPLMLAGHSSQSPYLDQLLAYCYLKGVVPCTVSQFYDKINEVRHKNFNIAYGNYETLVYLDNSIELSKRGMIIFSDPYSSIGASVADYYKNNNYYVGFWTDPGDQALSYLYPVNTAYLSNVPVVVNVNDRITLSNHGLNQNHIVYLTGDEAPGGLSFNTDYYVIRINSNEIKLTTSVGGTPLDISSIGNNVKINTHSYYDFAKNYAAAGLKTVKGIADLNNIVASNHPFNIDLKDHFMKYLQRQTAVTIDVSNSMLTGSFPVEMKSVVSLYILNAYNNKINGGTANIMNNVNITALRLNGNLINEELPSTIGNLTLLITLDLNTNQYHGTLPRTIGNLKQIKEFYIFSNNFNGVIPIELGTLPVLQRLRAQNNSFTSYETGAISTAQTGLVEVRFDGNQLATQYVDQILRDLRDCVAVSKKAGTVYLNGSLMGAPSGDITDPNTGLGAKYQLQNAASLLGAQGNWTVVTQ